MNTQNPQFKDKSKTNQSNEILNKNIVNTREVEIASDGDDRPDKTDNGAPGLRV